MMRNKQILMAGSAVIALALLPQSALAQEAVAPEAAPSPATTTAGTGADTAADSGEILVTAQRRQEVARDVPLTVTQLSAVQLADRGINNTNDLARVTPGLRMERLGPNTQASLRGISGSTTASGTESPVAFYLDGIYQLSLTGLTMELPDVKSIEVLKGPQGTLFGRNATGGAIQIFTLEPQYEFGGKFSASYGNYNDVILNGFVTGPLGDKVALSLSGGVHNTDGYLKDIVNPNTHPGSLKSHLIRGKLLVEPTENLKAVLTGFYALRNGHDAANQPLNGISIARNQPGAIIPQRPYEFAGTEATTNVKNFGGSLKLDLDTDIGTFSSLTGWTRWEDYVVADADRIFVPNQLGVVSIPFQNEEQFSQEVNFASRKFGRLSFVTGLFYYNGHGQVDPQLTLADFPTFIPNVAVYGKQNIRSLAAYGELNYELTDRLTVIAGIRYSDEKHMLHGIKVPVSVNPFPLPSSPTLPLLGKRHDTGFTPRVSVKYALTDLWNVYATYSKGFKSGAFNTTAFPPVTSVAPEKLYSYEVGSKARFGALDLNVSAFYYDYKDLQVSAALLLNGALLSAYQNAANAEVYGLDVDAALTITDQLRLTAGLALLSAKYKNFPNASVNIPLANKAGEASAFIDASGNYLNRAPKVTATVAAKYTTDLAGGILDFTPSLYYSSAYFFEANNRVKQSKYALLDAKLSFTPDGSDVTFAVYGRNLTDQAVLGGVFPSATSEAGQYSAPRTYGVSVAYKF